MILLDTDHTTFLKYPDSERGRRMIDRLNAVSASEVIGVAIVTVEERMRGWLAVIAKEKSAMRQVVGYRELALLFEFYEEFEIVPFDEAAARQFDRSPPAETSDRLKGSENRGDGAGQPRTSLVRQPNRFRKSARLASRELAGLTKRRARKAWGDSLIASPYPSAPSPYPSPRLIAGCRYLFHPGNHAPGPRHPCRRGSRRAGRRGVEALAQCGGGGRTRPTTRPTGGFAGLHRVVTWNNNSLRPQQGRTPTGPDPNWAP